MLEIQKSGLKTMEGGVNIPETGLLVRYGEARNEGATVKKFPIKYAIDMSFRSCIPCWEEEVPILDGEGNLTGQTHIIKMALPTEIGITITPENALQVIQEAEAMAKAAVQQMPQLEPIKPLIARTLEYHIPIKKHLEAILGENTVIIRLDLIAL